MPYYVVGRDWPDQFYATNAKWPTPNNWCYLPKDAEKRFHALKDESKEAREIAEQEAARRESKRLKKQLFNAIIQRDLETVRQMIRHMPLLLQRHTKFGATPLCLAAAVGDPDIVALLLDEGCDVAEGDCVGATPLITAAFRGHTAVCEQLLESKQGGNRGRQYLLRQATRRVGEVALHAAAKNGQLETVTFLLSVGADAAAVDREGRDSFMMAAANDHPNVMSYLLQNHGAEPNRRDLLGRTAVMHAAAGAALQAVLLLLSLSGSQAPEDKSGPGGCDLSLRDQRGYGPLHHACLGGSAEVVEALTQRGMALSAEDPESVALLRLACRSGHSGVVDWMIINGIGLKELMSDGGSGPMFAAVRGGSSAVVDVLLRHGARIDPRDSRGRTPLGVAAEAGDTRMCRHLVAAGASLLASDNHGRVPRRLAYLANKRETAEALSDMANERFKLPDDQVSEAHRKDLGEQAAE